MVLKRLDFLEAAIYFDNIRLGENKNPEYEEAVDRVLEDIKIWNEELKGKGFRECDYFMDERSFGHLEHPYCKAVMDRFSIDLEKEYRNKPNNTKMFEKDISTGLDLILELGEIFKRNQYLSEKNIQELIGFFNSVENQYQKYKNSIDSRYQYL